MGGRGERSAYNWNRVECPSIWGWDSHRKPSRVRGPLLFKGKVKDFSETVGNGKGSVTDHVTGDSVRTSSCISFWLREELSNYRLINRNVFKSVERCRVNLVEVGGEKQEVKKQLRRLTLEGKVNEDSFPRDRSSGIRVFLGDSLWKDFRKLLGEFSLDVRELKKRQ